MATTEQYAPATSVDKEWLERVGEALDRDEAYSELARWFFGTVLLEIGDAPYTLYFHKGRLIDVDEGRALTGADFTISGPSDEWERLALGEIDFGRATTPPVGKLTISGNVVKAAGNM